MNNEILINNSPLLIKEYNGLRVVTLKDIDTVHGRAEGTARKRFNDNRMRFIDGEDYFVRKTDEALREYGITAPNGLVLITESGYLMLVKSFTDNLAWSVQRQLVKSYFRAKQLDSYLIDDPIKRAERWIEEQKERLALQTTVNDQKQQIAEMKPKASYYDIVLNCTDLMTVNAIAKDYGKSAVWMNKWLNEHKVQYKQGDVWLLYQKYAQKGYTSSKTSTFIGTDGVQHCRTHTYWTQAGRLFIYDLLKEHGILPLIEQSNDET